MSSSPEHTCEYVLRQLEHFHGQDVSRVEEEPHFRDCESYHDALIRLNLKHEFTHIIDIDNTDDWAMSGDSNTTGSLCIAFKNYDGTITLLRECCRKNKDGFPYLSDAWLPENNFTKESPIPLSEQRRFLQMRYYEGIEDKRIMFFRYVFADDEEDERFQKPDEHTQALLDAGKLRRNSDGHYITQPPSEWKDGEDKDKALAEIEEINKQRKEVDEQAKAIELLIRNGMMKRNAEGELEFQRLPYKPTRIGVITPNS